MPFLSTELSQSSTDIIDKQLSSGSFKNSSEVLENALKLLDREAQDEAWKMWELRKAIQEGIDSPDAEGDIFAQVRPKFGSPPRATRA